MRLNKILNQNAAQLQTSFDQIPETRRELLQQLAAFIRDKKEENQPIKLVFICTHNSRRSHMAQLWAQAAATYAGINGVETFSGGTEATAFYPAAVKAMQELGFAIEKEEKLSNPKYEISYAENAAPVEIWSKKYDDEANPTAGFCAIMTCTEADGNCPFIQGAEKRIAIPYQDPKVSDGTQLQEQVYLQRARQIGREMLFVFSKV